MKKVVLFTMTAFALFLFSGISNSQTKFSKGDVVFAEWVHNGWYHGKIGATCDAGFTINFDDGDVKCCTPDKIVADIVPKAAAIKVGTRVLAQWTTGRYYPGKVTAIDKVTYHIQFDDGDKGTVSINQIRLWK